MQFFLHITAVLLDQVKIVSIFLPLIWKFELKNYTRKFFLLRVFVFTLDLTFYLLFSLSNLKNIKKVWLQLRRQFCKTYSINNALFLRFLKGWKWTNRFYKYFFFPIVQTSTFSKYSFWICFSSGIEFEWTSRFCFEVYREIGFYSRMRRLKIKMRKNRILK